MRNIATLCFSVLVVATTSVGAFTPLPRQDYSVRSGQTLVRLRDQPTNKDEVAAQQRQSQEETMEELAKKGAARVAKMDISERAKRAMLAEALEDSMFQHEIELEEIIGESGIIPTDPELREQCKDIATQIKASQKQYETLVSGLPSSLLDTLDNLGSD